MVQLKQSDVICYLQQDLTFSKQDLKTDVKDILDEMARFSQSLHLFYGS